MFYPSIGNLHQEAINFQCVMDVVLSYTKTFCNMLTNTWLTYRTNTVQLFDVSANFGLSTDQPQHKKDINVQCMMMLFLFTQNPFTYRQD